MGWWKGGKRKEKVKCRYRDRQVWTGGGGGGKREEKYRKGIRVVERGGARGGDTNGCGNSEGARRKERKIWGGQSFFPPSSHPVCIYIYKFTVLSLFPS